MIDGEANTFLGNSAIFPADCFDAYPFQVFIYGEEMLNLFEVVRREIRKFADVGKEWVVVQHRQNLVVRLAFVGHSEYTDRAGLDDAASKGWQIRDDQNVERVAIFIIGLWDEAVIAGVMHRRIQHPVELEGASLFMIFVLIARAFGNLDDHM